MDKSINNHISNILQCINDETSDKNNLNTEIQNFINVGIRSYKKWENEKNINISLLITKEFPLSFTKNQLIDIHNILLYLEQKQSEDINIKLIHLFFSGLIQNFEKGLEYFLLRNTDKKNDKLHIEHLDMITKMLSMGYNNNIKISFNDREYYIIVDYMLSIIDSNDFLKWGIYSQFDFLMKINRLFIFNRPHIFKKLCNSLGRLFNIYIENIPNNPFVLMYLYDGFRMIFWKSRVDPYGYVIAFNQNFTKPYAEYMDKYHNNFTGLKRKKKKKKKNICYMLTNTYCSPGYGPGFFLKIIHEAHHKYGSEDINFFVYSIGGFDRDVNYEYKTCLEQSNISIREFSSLRNHQDYLNILECANKDDIDLSIMNMNFSTQVFLFSAQIAPYQIYLSHGFSAFSPSNIDHHIWFDQELIPSCLQEYVEKNNYSITPIDYCPYYDTKIGKMDKKLEELKAKELLKYPQNKLIIGNMQSLERVTEEFLDIVVSILQNNENTIFLCCGSGDMSILTKYINKYKLQNRLFTPGFIDPHLYGHMIDIAMNTHVSSALSILDFLVKEKIVVSIPKDRIKPLALEKVGLMVKSNQEYEELITRLIRDKSFYQATKDKIKDNFKNYINSASGVQDFEKLINSL